MSMQTMTFRLDIPIKKCTKLTAPKYNQRLTSQIDCIYTTVE